MARTLLVIIIIGALLGAMILLNVYYGTGVTFSKV